MNQGRFALAASLTLLAPTARAEGLPPGFVQTVEFSGVSQIIDFDFDPSGGLWIVSRTGEVWLRRGGPAELALTLDVNAAGDSGISAITVDPDFDRNHSVWIAYTTPQPGAKTRLARFVNRGSVLIDETPIFEHPEASPGYNGGCLRFRSDGTLFFATGYDGEPLYPQDPHSLKGKLLRLNPDGTAPPDNPFADGIDGDPRVWAYGLRNPFRCGIQPGTDRLFLGDVGTDDWEEIDVPVAGANLGFPLVEGPNTMGGTIQAPLYSLWHTPGSHAIIGGDFAQGGDWSAEYRRDYIFADHNADKLLRMRFDQNGKFVMVTEWAKLTGSHPVSIRFGPDGALYYISWPNVLQRIAYVGGTGTGGRASGLYLAKVGSSGQIGLGWQASCQLGDRDYSIVEGTLEPSPDWTPKTCTTGGKTTRTMTPSAGNTFYLVVPHDGITLGSFGTSSDGVERTPRGRQCRPQKIVDCGS